MPSLREMIDNCIKDGERIVKIARTNMSEVAGRIEELGGFSELTREQVEAVIEFNVRQLESANRALAKAFRDVNEQESESATFQLNHRAADELERVLWNAQGRISEPFGPEMLKLYGLEESPPAGYRALATYAHNTVTLLRAPPQTLEGQFDDHLETERIAATIEGPLNALNDYLSTLDDAPAPIKSALQRRDSASDHWLRVWRGTSTVLEGFFVLAERADLAASVRPRLPGVAASLDTGELDNIEDAEIEFTSEL